MSELVIDWQEIATFWVPGEPVAQPRHRARAMRTWSENKQRMVWVARVYSGDEADDWKSAVRFWSLHHRPDRMITGPVRVDVVFFLPRPKYMMPPRWPIGPVPHTAKPDRDNLDKAVLDAMSEAQWWRDDAQVCAGDPTKVYHGLHGRPGANIAVSTLRETQPDLFGATGAQAGGAA